MVLMEHMSAGTQRKIPVLPHPAAHHCASQGKQAASAGSDGTQRGPCAHATELATESARCANDANNGVNERYKVATIKHPPPSDNTIAKKRRSIDTATDSTSSKTHQ